jgi:ankyrin repeat protein
MRAVEKDDVATVSLLVDQEAGMTDSDGRTALMRAAERGSAKCVSLLVAQEAGKSDSSGKTAQAGMTDACGRTALMRALCSSSSRFPATDSAKFRRSRLAIVELLIPKEAGIANSQGVTPLMAAVSHQVSDCIPLLIPAGARHTDKK